MSAKSPGRRIENFSAADVVEHGREARRKHRPIWTNPFLRERAALWRKGWHRPQDQVEPSEPPEAEVIVTAVRRTHPRMPLP